MSRESLRLIQRYEEAIAQLEEESIAQLDDSLDRAYRELERELLRRYERYSQGGFDLLGTQRSQQLINDLRGLLQVVRPEQAAEYEAIFRALIEQSGALGSELAVGLINEVDPGSLIRAFTGLPIEAVAAQARDSRERLQRHGDRFAREASVLIQSSLLQGHGATRAARALRSQLGTTRARAETIARTESMTALNRAAQETYARQGLQVQWMITPSDALCEFCGWRNMQVYAAGRVIVPAHPRCLVPGTIVSSTPVHASTSRQYRGQVVTIQTASGKKLTVTPNHPILTPQGWIGAGDINEGDYIFSCIDSERVTRAIAPDDNNRPSLIEEVIRSLRESTGVPSVSMKVSAEDFHGDGVGSEVCVISSDRLLRDDIKTQIFEQLPKDLFVDGLVRQFSLFPDRLSAFFFPRNRSSSGCIMCRSDLPNAVFSAHSLPLKTFSLGLGSDWHAGIDQHGSDKASTHLARKLLSDRIFRFSRDVFTDNKIPELVTHSLLESRNTFTSNPPLLTHAPLQTPFLDSSPQDVGAEMKGLSSVLNRFSGLIQRDRVVNTFRSEFEGHVYNLETQTGWYFANDILTHNCRCILVPFSEKWQGLGLTDDEFALDYRNRNLAAMAAQGITPNEGLTPFERSAGLAEPPRSLWMPGQN